MQRDVIPFLRALHPQHQNEQAAKVTGIHSLQSFVLQYAVCGTEYMAGDGGVRDA